MLQSLLSNDESHEWLVMNQNLEKCALIMNNKKIRIIGIEFYKLINNHPFWKVNFKDVRLNTVIVREDALPAGQDADQEEIKYTIIGIPYRECKDDNIPLGCMHLIRFKEDILSKYEID